ncbi:MAG TPA: hypothetical protein VFA34_00305 [Actinomycetota bacterium]|nr:hypothetical protein [Actinomycetota bacterium]
MSAVFLDDPGRAVTELAATGECRAVIDARLDRLPVSERRVLTRVAAIGAASGPERRPAR